MKKPTDIQIPVESPYWSIIKDLTEEYFEKKLENLLELHKEQLKAEFKIDLKTLIEQWQERIYDTAKRHSKNRLIVGRKRVVSACKFLRVKPPIIGEPVDLKEAAKQMKLMARMYHPDMHDGSEETKDLYIKAIQSFETLRNYNNSLNRSVHDQA